MNVKKYREQRGLATKEIADGMKTVFPGYDKTLQSKVERPEKYGITMTTDAFRVIQALYGPAVERVQENRTLPCRVTVRLSKELHASLQRRRSAEGFDTNQNFLHHIIEQYLKEV